MVILYHFSPIPGLKVLDPQAPKRMPASEAGWIYLTPHMGWDWCGEHMYKVKLPDDAPVWWRDIARGYFKWQKIKASRIEPICRQISMSADFEIRVNYKIVL